MVQNLPEVAYLAYLLYAVSLAKRFTDFKRIRGSFLDRSDAALGKKEVKDGRTFTPFPEVESGAQRNKKTQVPRAYRLFRMYPTC